MLLCTKMEFRQICPHFEIMLSCIKMEFHTLDVESYDFQDSTDIKTHLFNPLILGVIFIISLLN